MLQHFCSFLHLCTVVVKFPQLHVDECSDCATPHDDSPPDFLNDGLRLHIDSLHRRSVALLSNLQMFVAVQSSGLRLQRPSDDAVENHVERSATPMAIVLDDLVPCCNTVIQAPCHRLALFATHLLSIDLGFARPPPVLSSGMTTLLLLAHFVMTRVMHSHFGFGFTLMVLRSFPMSHLSARLRLPLSWVLTLLGVADSVDFVFVTFLNQLLLPLLNMSLFKLLLFGVYNSKNSAVGPMVPRAFL